MYYILIAVMIIAADQASKFFIINNLKLEQQIKVIDGFFYLTHWRNKGAAWGMMQNGGPFFVILTSIISVVIIYIILKSKDKPLKISLCFILGGALGNLADRVFRKSVVDFIEIYFGKYQYPVFNIADSFVVIGTIILVIYLLFFQKENIKESVV